jgi:hypothetical protein
VPDPPTVATASDGIQVTPGPRRILIEASRRDRALAWTVSFYSSDLVFGAQGVAQDGVDEDDDEGM